MPLPAPQPRDEIHLRDLVMRGYQRHDGLFDIEGRMTDRKPMAFEIRGGPLARTVPPMQPVHDMWVRLGIDLAMNVHEACASSDATPFEVCRTAPPTVERVLGLNIGKGWARGVRERLGGVQGCTHLMELLITLGTVAFQSLVPARRDLPEPVDAQGRPRQMDTCLAYAHSGPVVAVLWPEHHRPSPPADRTT